MPSGRRWAREAVGRVRSPINTVASHRGRARAMFIDSCVVGVKVYGSRPSRLVKRRRINKEMRIKDCLRPEGLIGSMICFVALLINQDLIVTVGCDSH